MLKPQKTNGVLILPLSFLCKIVAHLFPFLGNRNTNTKGVYTIIQKVTFLMFSQLLFLFCCFPIPILLTGATLIVLQGNTSIGKLASYLCVLFFFLVVFLQYFCVLFCFFSQRFFFSFQIFGFFSIASVKTLRLKESAGYCRSLIISTYNWYI